MGPMDPNPSAFPILSYVMSKVPSISPRRGNNAFEFDIEQPPPPPPPPSDPSTSKGPYFELTERMPYLSDPKVIASMRLAVSDVAKTRSILQNLGERPDHESVDAAKAKIAEIDSGLTKELEDILLAPGPADVDRMQWRLIQAKKEEECRKVADKEKQLFKAVISLDEMHESYGKLLKEAEQKLQRIYDAAAAGRDPESLTENPAPAAEEVSEEVIAILQDACGRKVETIDLSGRKLRHLPEAFGTISSLVFLNLSSNQLEVIPDSIAGLENLHSLNLSSNHLESLPDSIGFLVNLKTFDVSSNKLSALPDSISYCRSLLELDASFNKLTYLPTNMGYQLVHLQRLSAQLNKIRSLPTSIGEMNNLRLLDLHFNELRGLPHSIGRLTNLEILNLSSNFSDLTELPDAISDLTNLKELDLSNNQIHELPLSFGRLSNLIKLNLDQNPIVVPPKEIVAQGVEAVKVFMTKRWLDIILDEERKNEIEAQERQLQTSWLARSASWLNNFVMGISASGSGQMEVMGKGREDPYLNKQL